MYLCMDDQAYCWIVCHIRPCQTIFPNTPTSGPMAPNFSPVTAYISGNNTKRRIKSNQVNCMPKKVSDALPPALVGCLAKVKWTHLVDSHVMGNQIRLNVRQKVNGWLAVVKMAVLSTRQSSPNINGESDSIEKLNQLPSIVGENVERELFLFKDNLLRFLRQLTP